MARLDLHSSFTESLPYHHATYVESSNVTDAPLADESAPSTPVDAMLYNDVKKVAGDERAGPRRRSWIESS